MNHDFENRTPMINIQKHNGFAALFTKHTGFHLLYIDIVQRGSFKPK